MPLSTVTERIFGVPRFKHVYAEHGVPYLDSEDIFKINPELTKLIPKISRRDAATYQVAKGWLLMACSGQLYGLNGRVVLADTWHQGKVVSNHVLRIVPRADSGMIRPGYLQVALDHPVYGRPLVRRLAFGSSVPEIAAQDLGDFSVAQADIAMEERIADCVERASALRMGADAEEDAAVTTLEIELRAALGDPAETGGQPWLSQVPPRAVES